MQEANLTIHLQTVTYMACVKVQRRMWATIQRCFNSCCFCVSPCPGHRVCPAFLGQCLHGPDDWLWCWICPDWHGAGRILILHQMGLDGYLEPLMHPEYRRDTTRTGLIMEPTSLNLRRERGFAITLSCYCYWKSYKCHSSQ